MSYRHPFIRFEKLIPPKNSGSFLILVCIMLFVPICMIIYPYSARLLASRSYNYNVHIPFIHPLSSLTMVQGPSNICSLDIPFIAQALTNWVRPFRLFLKNNEKIPLDIDETQQSLDDSHRRDPTCWSLIQEIGSYLVKKKGMFHIKSQYSSSSSSFALLLLLLLLL